MVKKVYPVPLDIDQEIARLKLASMGIEIDTLTPEQEKYLSSWEMGLSELYHRFDKERLFNLRFRIKAVSVLNPCESRKAQ